MWEIHDSDVGDLGSMWEIFYVAYFANILMILGYFIASLHILYCRYIEFMHEINKTKQYVAYFTNLLSSVVP